MKSAAWNKAIKSAADPERTAHYLTLFAATPAGPALEQFSAEQARILAAVFSGSPALGAWLVSNPEGMAWIEPEVLNFPRRKQGLRKEINGWLEALLSARDYGPALTQLRRFKQSEMFRIAARDLARLADVSTITQEISDVADTCLDSVWRICLQQLTERHGQPYHQDASGRWQPTTACVFGMGKLGGEELNYSSDVDVIFVYAEEGSVFREKPSARSAARPTLANHQFYNRLAESFIAEVTRMAPEGALFRIDLRLRPEGDSGPLSRSLAGYENYYAQWGQTWERMMLIKARCVAGSEALGAEFLEMIQAFRYPRSTNENVLHEVAAMKDRIENEVVKAGELERNVKLGYGGIREIEFVAQSLQLLHAGHQPFLQGARTLPTLEKLVQYELLSQADERQLAAAYAFLRDLEHRLQMENNRQTHTIPVERPAQERLGRLMGFARLREFVTAKDKHSENVRRIFDRVLKAEVPEEVARLPFPRHFEGAESVWKEWLAAHAFKDTDKAFRVLREFVEGPGYVHVSPRTKDLALQLLPKLFALCPQPAPEAARPKRHGKAVPAKRSRTEPNPKPPLSDPDRVVTRLDSFIVAYGARATLFELWNSNPSIFELLVLLFDRSEFLAELAIRVPDLVDELVTSDRLRQRKTAEETLADLRHGAQDADQHLWLRRYHQAELMRIGLRDILGLADFEQYLIELSALAEACLQYALEVVLRRHKLKGQPLAIIGLGKLGGAEIDYGSDLDLLFVTDSKAKNFTPLSRAAIDVMDLLSRRTEHGLVFHTDARLRPDGDKGVMVNTPAAYEEYYRERAQLWELQALSRARAVAGSSTAAGQFEAMTGRLTNFRSPAGAIAALAPDWRSRIAQMRRRIEKERTPAGKDELAIKTGRGGLMDAEFVAQALCLGEGWREPSTLRALERGRQERVLKNPEGLIESYRRLRRVEGILRRWSYEGETVLPEDPAPYYRVAIRCGFSDAAAFREAIAEWRREIRAGYLEVFPA